MNVNNHAKKTLVNYWQGRNFIMKNLTNLIYPYFFLFS